MTITEHHERAAIAGQPGATPAASTGTTSTTSTTGTMGTTGAVVGPRALRFLAVSRIIIGLVFLWAFVDKTVGLGFATTSKGAWLRGGSPTNGFLSGVAVGPLEGFFHRLAGNPVIDALFMLGLLAVGLAFVAGVGMRLMAAAGAVMMAMMWAAEWPLARHDSAGEVTRSTNPVLDYHVVYAVTLVALAIVPEVGRTWGLGRQWQALPLVKDHPTLW